MAADTSREAPLALAGPVTLGTLDETGARLRRAKADGLNVTCDTAPPYFALNENAIGDYRTFAKLSPPLRNEDARQAVVEGLKDGTIDAIASDHTPRDEESKRLPFAQAAPGGGGGQPCCSGCNGACAGKCLGHYHRLTSPGAAGHRRC